MRFNVPALDRELGIEVYLTDTTGVGGNLRRRNDDFMVEEIPLGTSSVEEFTSSSLSRTPSRYENYAICLLEKRGIDTLRAVGIIAQRLHLKEEEVGYGGLKDARAVSRQLISIPMRRPLQREYEFSEGIWLQILGFRYRPISLGELTGNQFSITARKITHESNWLVRRLDETTRELRKAGGFPGYYGYQRFGSRRPISHLVGKCFCQGDVEGAVQILLRDSSIAEPMETVDSGTQFAAEADYEDDARFFPQSLHVERRVLHHLRKHPHDFEGALRKLPNRLLKLFNDAYQSFIFNKALSLRLRDRVSLIEVQPGDLVAAFDERGYVRRLTRVSTNNLAKIQSQLKRRKTSPVLSLPSGLETAVSQPTSAEVAVVLESEGLHPRVSTLRGGEATNGGIVRSVLVEAESLGWITGEDEDNLGSRKVTFHFRLRRGFYATVLLREFLKPQNPLTAGF